MAADALAIIAGILQSNTVYADDHAARNDNTEIASSHLCRFKDLIVSLTNNFRLIFFPN